MGLSAATRLHVLAYRSSLILANNSGGPGGGIHIAFLVIIPYSWGVIHWLSLLLLPSRLEAALDMDYNKLIYLIVAVGQ